MLLNALRLATLIFATTFTAIAFSQETKLVVPPGLEATFGNESGFAPTIPSRLQYLYDGDYFSSVPGPLSISGLAWRANEGSPAINSTDADVIVRLSTSSASSLSSLYSDNVGVDELQVYRGPLTIESPNHPTPDIFGLPVAFNEPFTFDPSAGSLLVDVTFSGFDQTWQVDNQTFSDEITRLIVGNASATSAANTWPILAPMQFTVETVPEPTSHCGPIIAFAIIAMGPRRKRFRNR